MTSHIDRRDDKSNPYRPLKTEQGVFTTPPYSSELKGLWRFKDRQVAQESAEALWERFKLYRDASDFIGMDITRKFIQMGRTRSLRYALRKGGRKYLPTPATLSSPPSHPSPSSSTSSASSSSSSPPLSKPKSHSMCPKNTTGKVDRQDTTIPPNIGTGQSTQTRPGKGRGKLKTEIIRDGTVYDQVKLDGASIFGEYEKKCWGDEVYTKMWGEWGGSAIGVRSQIGRSGVRARKRDREGEGDGDVKEESEEEMKDVKDEVKKENQIGRSLDEPLEGVVTANLNESVHERDEEDIKPNLDDVSPSSRGSIDHDDRVRPKRANGVTNKPIPGTRSKRLKSEPI